MDRNLLRLHHKQPSPVPLTANPIYWRRSLVVKSVMKNDLLAGGDVYGIVDVGEPVKICRQPAEVFNGDAVQSTEHSKERRWSPRSELVSYAGAS